MIETLKAMILDFHESSLETGVPRRVSLRAVSGKASVCIGVRRSGKPLKSFRSGGSCSICRNRRNRRMRFRFISDTHGKIGIINELAARAQADVLIHGGDFGFYDDGSYDRLSCPSYEPHLPRSFAAEPLWLICR